MLFRSALLTASNEQTLPVWVTSLKDVAGCLAERHVEDVLSENQTDEGAEVERKGRQSGKYKKLCTTDPDATGHECAQPAA